MRKGSPYKVHFSRDPTEVRKGSANECRNSVLGRREAMALTWEQKAGDVGCSRTDGGLSGWTP